MELVVGLMIGGMIGFLAAALCAAAKGNDCEIYHEPDTYDRHCFDSTKEANNNAEMLEKKA